MTWVKLDDGFADHPKVVALSDSAFRAHVSALCYASRQLTDGFIPEEVALKWAPVAHIALLLARKLWDRVEGGFQIHDYLEYQVSKQRVQNWREGNRARQERWYNASRQKVLTPLGQRLISAGSHDPNAVRSNGDHPNAVTNAAPSPSPSPISLVPKKGERRSSFTIPTFDELSAYIIAKNYRVDPSRFLAYYDSNGWKVGKNPMRSWKGALYSWHSRPAE